MLFCLLNAPTSFQGNIIKILNERLYIFITAYVNDILIYTENAGQLHVNAVRCVRDELSWHSFFANLKKSRFQQNEFRFLEFMIVAQSISMEEKRIETIKV